MERKKKKFYITTSIAYTNAPPHIGFALESVQADVIARYQRLLRKDVFFLTGTDEHGTKIARAAEKAGKKPQEFVDEITAQFKSLKNVLNLSNDDFIRTTDQKRHWPTVKKVWLKLKENRDIYKKKYRGLYCVGCESFVKEKDLINGKCPNHQKGPEIIEEENYFFKLSRYSERVKKEIKSGKIRIIPESRKNEIISFMERGIEDVSISRAKENLSWGIPVPGDTNQTIYVWFEALLNYLFPKKYWPANVHCLGKDIFRFHVLMWPAILLALKLDRPKNILIHGFITSDGQKMSKSLGNVVDPFGLVKKYSSTSSLQAGTDAVRYFLLREIPPTGDGDFTYEKFEQRYDADLAGGLGNFVARVITLAAKFKIKKGLPGLNKIINKVKKRYKNSLTEFKLNEALIAIWDLISYCDTYIDKEKPWFFSPVQDKQKCKEVIGNLLFNIGEIAKLLQPFLPETSEKILKQLKTNKVEILFPRLK